MVGQIALAEHSASHINHGLSQEIVTAYSNHDEHQHDKDNNNRECPECLLTQSLQAAFYNAPTIFSLVQQEEILTLSQQSVDVSIDKDKAHPVRAPPAILI